MLQMPNQQPVQSCEQASCLASIPLDKCCLVVQMPSIEEMKREVADITCKMQSVYIDPKMDDDVTKPSDYPEHDSVIQDTRASGNDLSSDFETSKIKKYADNNHSHNRLERLKSCTFGSTPNTNSASDKDEDFLLPTSSVKTSSSTLPREEQVFEEFVINGKRYRQVYQRRVVLERRTTRDVFFLPANNPDSDVNPSGLRCFEYTSPEFNDDKPILGSEPLKEMVNNRARPGLDLTVLRPLNGNTGDENGIEPAVIMRGVPDLCRSSKTNSLDRPSQNGTMTSPKPNTSNTATGSSTNHIEAVVESSMKQPISSSETEQSDRKLDHCKGRNIMKNLTDSIKRHIQCGPLKIKKPTKYGSTAPTKTCTDNGVADKSVINGVVAKISKASQSSNGGRENSDSVSREMFGYMYKFGVWDDQEPVLDPRLPRALSSSKRSSSGLDGTVIPTAPEWHHAEVGLEHAKFPNSPFIRGRTVACLQRFTQHSSASGKPLHRSTYVQQTRLVRQKNRDAPVKQDSSQSNHVEEAKTNETNEGSRSSLQAHPDSNTAKSNSSEPINANAAYNERDSSWQLDTMEFEKCSHDRLQLLQSLCPSAAAAAILLGKRILSPSSLGSDSESAFEKLSEMDDLGETSVMVTAKTWCPATLLVKDPSPFLVFNTHGETSSPTVLSTSGCRVSPGPTGLPELSIRGGTLDALLIYIIHLLQLPSSGRCSQFLDLSGKYSFRVHDVLLLGFTSQLLIKYPDCLLPDVLRVTYPTFTTPDKIIQRLIQFYVAYAPIEPGCKSSDWMNALVAVEYLITIVQRLQSDQLSASLVLRLIRFARLLKLDGQTAVVKSKTTNESPENEQDIIKTPHHELADRLSSKLPVLSSTSRLRFYSSDYPTESNDQRQNQLSNGPKPSLVITPNSDDAQHDSITKLTDAANPLSSIQLGLNAEGMEPVIQRVQQFLASDPLSIAEELTRLEEERFMQINFQELLDIPQLERGEAKSLGVCVEHFNKLTKWARSLLFVLSPKLAENEESLVKLSKKQMGNSAQSPLPDPLPKRSSSHSRNSLTNATKLTNHMDQSSNGFDRRNKPREGESGIFRQKSCHIRFSAVGSSSKTLPIRQMASINSMFMHMCEILKHLNQLNNFSSFLALLLAIQEVPDCILSKKSKTQLAAFSAYMKPPNFAEYRRDLEAAELPCLPYLGLIFQQLIHLHAGNPIFLPDVVEHAPKYDVNGLGGNALTGAMSSVAHPEKLVNIWRCWKHYLILGYFVKREEGSPKSRHNIPLNEKVNQILNNFNDCFPDNVLDFAKDQLVGRTKTKRNFRT